MQTNEPVQVDLRRWLLGLLSEQDSYSLEERLITDAALYEELHIAEDELIDGYLAGGLTVSERKAFENYFMNSSERQEQFRIANALRVYIDDSKQNVPDPQIANALPRVSSVATAKPNSRWLPLRKTIAAVALAAAALLVVVFVWLTLSSRSPSPGNSLAVVLTPSEQTRGGGSVQTVHVGHGIEFLQLHLRLARNDFQKYRATLVNSAGNVVHTSENLTPSSDVAGPTVQFSLRTTQTPAGEYQLKLDGVDGGRFESAESYRFVIITQ